MDQLPAATAGAWLIRRRIRTRRSLCVLADAAARQEPGVAPSGALSDESAKGGSALALLLSLLLHLGALAALLAWPQEPARAPGALVPIDWVVVAERTERSAARQAAPVVDPSRARPPRRRVVSAPVPSGPAAPEATVPEAAPTAAEPQPALAAVSAGVSSTPARPASPIALPRGGYQVKPVFPRLARARGASGTALLRVRIAPDGEVAELLVERSSGHEDLDRSALAAVGRWHFEPLEGAVGAAGLWVQIPIEFRLDR